MGFSLQKSNFSEIPINNLNYSISLLKEIIEKTNINGIEIIDLRINNRIILS